MVIMDSDCITISDDEEEVQILEQFMTCEPIVIDLTESESFREQSNPDPEFQADNIFRQQTSQIFENESGYFRKQSMPIFGNGSPFFREHLSSKFTSAPESNSNQSNTTSQTQPENHRNLNSHQDGSQTLREQSNPSFGTRTDENFQEQSNSSPETGSESPPREERPTEPVVQEQSNERRATKISTEPAAQERSAAPIGRENFAAQPPPPKKEKPAVQPQPPANNKEPLTDREQMIAKKELGNKHYRNNHLNEAVRLYREASDLARKLDDRDLQAILHFNLAMTYSRLGSYTQAIDECAAAVKIDNNYLKAHCKRAEIYMSIGKYDEAVICYEYICEIEPAKKEEAMRRIQFAREMSKRTRRLDQLEILGLSSHFSIEELRKAYRKKARTHHPDRHSDADVVTRRIQEKIFKEASEAYAFFQKRYGFH